jgi:hypothetical protein
MVDFLPKSHIPSLCSSSFASLHRWNSGEGPDMTASGLLALVGTVSVILWE